MTTLFKKLNFKNQPVILSLNHPVSFEAELKAMSKDATVLSDAKKLKSIEFAIVFCTQQSEVDKAAAAIAPKLISDGVLWFCYPKGSSKKYTCDFNRDTGWNKLGEQGFEPVRMVALDEDWSALRFRKVEHIKTMTRSFAISEKGKEKVKAAKKKS